MVYPSKPNEVLVDSPFDIGSPQSVWKLVSVPSIRLSSIGNLGHFQPPWRMDNSPIFGVPPLYHLFRLLEDEDIAHSFKRCNVRIRRNGSESLATVLCQRFRVLFVHPGH
ncbi:hypothetical protein DAPPUDRAFT_270626 [Daphnia pulex]|uniref:Uncharacterized protein n=1 Tax=Daphnia pulex TaxID=6669 RepID=E9I113_DAPPU|nr:hypothetical protein DAPPUDRAFT_270626 [Daphnia pulex]|eukprot:EFX62317.1 hypothetical protein DAPPUDRAFT_270626 [Daphnia pulex]